MYQNGGTMTTEMSGVTSRMASVSSMIDHEGGMTLDVDMTELATSVPTGEGLTFDPMAGQSTDQTVPITTANNTSTRAAAAERLTAAQSNGSNMNAIGAGPLPAGFGMLPTPNSGSTLTEFTKRRNWSKLILEELRDMLLILSPDGRMRYVSPSSQTLTGYEPQSLVAKFVADFVHNEDKIMFQREFNESIASCNQLRFFYRFRKENGSFIIFEAFGHPHYGSDSLGFGTNQGARNCRGFFMISRPYPTKNAALLDSFLEHKIENERLTRRIEELKREEQQEQEESDRHWAKRDTRSSVTQSDTQRTDTRTETDNSVSVDDGMPPPPRPTVSNTALTRQNLDEALAASRPDSINDKMARYEGSSHIETIEMLTGLRYRDGERAQGISTGAASPALIRGDVGIAILTDRESRSNSDKKKKVKLAEEYVCTDCGTLDSPEWRKGPNGPKTLCNACGLRWAKKEKRRHPGTGSQSVSSKPQSSQQQNQE